MLVFLDQFFAQARNTYQGVNRWGPDSLERLRNFVAGGKMIRGSLVRFTHDMYQGKAPKDALAVGAAMELFQSAFLIHDDIMDRDEIRRGMPSIHAQYQTLCREEGLPESSRLGEALGICVGDIAIFLAFEILSALDSDPALRCRLLHLFGRELQYVGLAQMADVYNGASSHPSSREEILALYRYKTGRYTFSLPFAAGLILAHQGDDRVEPFMLLGEKMGLLFQIKDDELGIWGDEEELGKPVGSDLAENKKTLYRELLFSRASDANQDRLASIFGGPAPTEDDLTFVRDQLETLEVRQEVAALMEELSGESRTLMHSLSQDRAGPWQGMLEDLLAFNIERKK